MTELDQKQAQIGSSNSEADVAGAEPADTAATDSATPTVISIKPKK